MNKNKIDPGQLRKKVTIKKITVTASSTGEEAPTEVDFVTVRAGFRDVSGNESEEGKIIALNVREYIIRYNAEIAQNGTQMRIFDIEENDTYNIHSVSHLGHKQYLALKCSKKE